ncbi:hypothetical protein BGZ51_007046 [Haplosporangium sp. Z 767]|nr:hypothetical protein BGZ51_007046 [Haplosporangium sp. Z 767]
MPDLQENRGSELTSATQNGNTNCRSTLYQSYQQQLENLKRLPVPYSDLYQSLSSFDTTHFQTLCSSFQKAASDLRIWLETAERAISGLEMDVAQQGVSDEQDVGEIDVVLTRFHPSIDMLLELKDKIMPRLQPAAFLDPDNTKTGEPLLTGDELTTMADAIQQSWSSIERMMERINTILASARNRTGLLTQMEDVLAEIEDIGLRIDSFQEELSRPTPNAETPRPTLSVSNPPFSLPISSTEPITGNAEDPKGKQYDVEALAHIDTQIESLKSTIATLTTLIETLPPDDPKREEMQDQYSQILRLWDDATRRRDRIDKDLKEKRWLAVFDQVAGQVESMMESVDRAIIHCRGLIDQIKAMVRDNVVPTAPIDRDHLYTIFKSFEAKHKYYAPAVNKMLSMLENGIESRMTQNVDVIQKHQAMRQKWEQLQGGLDGVELDLNDIERMLDILDASIPSYMPTPPTQLPEKPLFAMRRSQAHAEWKSPEPPSLFQPPQQSQQPQRGRRPPPAPSSSSLSSPQSAANTPVRSRARSPMNIPSRQRPWSPAPSTGSLPTMLSPNMPTGTRSLSRSLSRSPSRANSDKLRPWCPSTKTTSPSIPGIPHAPSMAAVYTPRPGSSMGYRHDASLVPTSSHTGSSLTRSRSISCVSSISSLSSQTKPVFSPAGSLSRLSTGAQAPRSISPTPGSSSGRKSQLSLPPPVATNTTRLRQNSAPSAPSAYRRSSSPLPPGREASTIAKSSISSSSSSSLPPASRSRKNSNQGTRSNSQLGHHERPQLRRTSLGNSSAAPVLRASGYAADKADSAYGPVPGSATESSPGATLSEQRSRPLQQQQNTSSKSSNLSVMMQDMKIRQSAATRYIPVRGDDLDEEFARVLNANPIQLAVRRLKEGKYYFGGRVEAQTLGGVTTTGGKMVLCRLMEYGRAGAGTEDDSGVSSGGSQSGTEDGLQQQLMTKAPRRPEPVASRSTRPRASSFNSASSTASRRNRKVMVRVGGGWQDLDIFLLSYIHLAH